MNKSKIQVLQFGTGNFLRGFIEPMIQELNQKGNFLHVCLVQSTDSTTLEGLRVQNFAYSVYVAGIEQGEKIEKTQSISCISEGIRLPDDYDQFISLALEPELRWLISNVTEAGLEWKKEDQTKEIPGSFVGRLSQWLYARFEHAPELETVLLPCELIPNNGNLLKDLIHRKAAEFQFSPNFLLWLDQKCTFHNTLVDRIVPGFPKHLDTAAPYTVQVEPYLFWGIEGNEATLDKLPFKNCNGVLLTDSLLPYSQRKISILNGLHTFLAANGMLIHIETVADYLKDPLRLSELNLLLEEEIFPFLNQPMDSLRDYAAKVFDRFKNPFVAHSLRSISFQSVSKFKMRLAPIGQYYLKKNGALPPFISQGLVALILCHLRLPNQMQDTEEALTYFKQLQQAKGSELDKVMLASKDLFDFEDLEGIKMAYSKLLLTLAS
ncbi:MAG: tagaturonate reductase [Algoriphagus sp.]|jgi:tagaturonate reductase